MRRLIAALDDEDFEAREKASAGLAKLGAKAEPAVREALRGSPTPEVRQRLEAVLKRWNFPEAASARVRWLRALEVLELIGDAAARDVVARLAEGTAQAPSVTVEARQTLDRLKRRPAR